MTGSAPLDIPTPERSQHPPRARRVSVVAGVLLAFAIVAAAWYAGAQRGGDPVGRGGVNRTQLPKAGEPAPDLVALDAAGEPVTLSGFRGQPVWLNFWGSWCPPCRSELPQMQAAYERLAPQGLVLFAVSLDESVADAVRYAERNGATYLIAGDPYRKGSSAYPIASFPTHVLIDREGIVRDVVLGELTEEQFVARAEAILDEEGSG